jgi:hypothetical protein
MSVFEEREQMPAVLKIWWQYCEKLKSYESFCEFLAQTGLTFSSLSNAKTINKIALNIND